MLRKKNLKRHNPFKEFERNATLRRLEQTDKRIEITANRVWAKSTFGTDDLQKINDALTQAVRLEYPSADPVKFESIKPSILPSKGNYALRIKNSRIRQLNFY